MNKSMINNRFLEETEFAIADGYCVINLTKNYVPGVMYQVIDGRQYNLNEQLGCRKIPVCRVWWMPGH